MRKLSVLMVSPSLESRGGISAVAGRLTAQLHALGWRVGFIGSRVDGPRWQSALHTAFSYFRFVSSALRRRPDLIHIHCSENLSYYRKQTYVFLAMLMRRRVVLHVHPDRFVEFCARARFPLRLSLKRVFAYAEAVIVLSETTRRRLLRLYPDARIFVLPNPVQVPDFRCGPEAEAPEVLYMGWFIPEKGVYDLLEAVPGVVREVPAARFVFCGTYFIDRLREACAAPELRGHVDIRGWVTGDEKIEALSRASLLVLPSYTEGFPNVVLEAMASCLPVVTTPVGANPEILKDGINGFFHPPGDTAALQEKIIRLLKDSSLRREMGRRNRALVEERFDAHVIGNELTRIYTRLAAGE